ncbi:MAG: glycosyltransferase family 2 protein [Sulfurovaceae bacterium]
MTNLISVILPVYNGALYLDEAIKSILSQTYSNFEFIIINDGSTDNSLEIINRYTPIDDRMKVISRENRGLITSLNEGIEKSEGTYIARIDQDDVSYQKII